MSSSVDKSSVSKSLFSSENIVYAGIGWGVLALLFFLLFGVSAPGQDSPSWYLIGTYVLELVPFLAAAILCFRNWRSPQIASGRKVWLGIGIGMICYFIAGLLFGWWELYWGLDPDVSPADLFYMAFYIFIGWAMILAVLPRRLNLELWQWGTIGAIALLAIALAVWVTIAASNAEAKATATLVATQQPVPVLVQNQPVSPPTNPATNTPVIESDIHSNVPSWVISTEVFLSQFAQPINFFYVIGDVFLLILASALLLAFWGGRFSQSWRMIAAAAFCLYIADMGFKYVSTLPQEYESGSLSDVFFVFSGVLFAIGAALEYDVSSRSRRGGRRRAG